MKQMFALLMFLKALRHCLLYKMLKYLKLLKNYAMKKKFFPATTNLLIELRIQ